MALQAVLLFGMGGSFRALDTAPMASQATGGIPGIHRVRDGWCTAAGHNDRARKSNGINLMDRSLLHCTGLNSAGRRHYGPRASPPRRTALSRPQPGRWHHADVLSISNGPMKPTIRSDAAARSDHGCLVKVSNPVVMHAPGPPEPLLP